MAVVYRHRRLDTNEVFYIGIGKAEKRAHSKYSRNKYWHNIVNKYGYIIEILSENLYIEDACELEEFLISLYGRKDLGLGTLVNMTDGGEGLKGYVTSEETKLKLSISHKGLKYKPWTEERKQASSLRYKGILKFPNRIKASMSLRVMDTVTGEVFPSIRSASQAIGMNEETLRLQLKGTSKNKTNLKLLEE